MKHLLKNAVIRWLLILNITALVVYGIRLRAAWQSHDAEIARLNRNRANKAAQVGYMSAIDSDKLHRIYESVRSTGQIEPADFTWCIALLREPPPIAGVPQQEIRSDMAISTILAAKQFSPSQEEDLYQVAELMFSMPIDPRFGLNQKNALWITERIGDHRLVPRVKEMLDNPAPNVRQYAQKVLRQLGA